MKSEMTLEQFDALIEYVDAKVAAGGELDVRRTQDAYYKAKALFVSEPDDEPETEIEKCFICGNTLTYRDNYTVLNDTTETWVKLDKKCEAKIRKKGRMGYITANGEHLRNIKKPLDAH